MNKFYDEDFWARIVPYHTELEIFAARITKNEQFAADLLNDAFVKLWLIRDNISSIADIKAFLYVTMRNYWIDGIRKTQRNRTVQLNEDQEIQYDEEDDKVDNYEVVMATIDKIPVNYKKAIQLHYLNQCSHKEVAAKMGISEPNARKYCSRGLQEIRKLITKIKTTPY
jgi:RNA polymerase sigma-70 factor (ECF subfamily)